jgi:hypothetical protein
MSILRHIDVSLKAIRNKIKMCFLGFRASSKKYIIRGECL